MVQSGESGVVIRASGRRVMAVEVGPASDVPGLSRISPTANRAQAEAQLRVDAVLAFRDTGYSAAFAVQSVIPLMVSVWCGHGTTPDRDWELMADGEAILKGEPGVGSP